MCSADNLLAVRRTTYIERGLLDFDRHGDNYVGFKRLSLALIPLWIRPTFGASEAEGLCSFLRVEGVMHVAGGSRGQVKNARTWGSYTYSS